MQSPEGLKVLARRQQRVEGDLLGHNPQFGRRLPAIEHSVEQLNLTAVEPYSSGNRPDQRRLSGAVRPEQRQKLTLLKIERGPVEAVTCPNFLRAFRMVRTFCWLAYGRRMRTVRASRRMADSLRRMVRLVGLALLLYPLVGSRSG
jgi:hypothetical protein